jgi:hypothetical protein
MRYLWLAFLIGWSSSAYAAMGTSPSVDVPITISSSGPTPPPGAVAAGFSTLAFNSDFAQPFYATQSNWLGCYSPTSGFPTGTYQWYQGGWNDANEPPCNANQVFDSVAGSNVLDVQWQPSYNNQYSRNNIVIQTENHDTTKVADFGSAYFEAALRLTAATNPNHVPVGAFWTWGTESSRGRASPIEWDFVEFYDDPGCCGGSIHNWGNNNDPSQSIWVVPAGFDPTVYHTYGFRITSDGSTQIEGCGYLDGKLMGCIDAKATTTEFNLRNYVVIQNGGTTSVSDLYIKYVRVWSCANWQTTMCNGTVLTGAP